MDCWSGDWGLPSVHPECLKILAFAKFSGAPVVQRSSNNPFWTPRGDLPVFRHNGRVLTDFQAVRQGASLDALLRSVIKRRGLIQCCRSGSGIRCLFDPWFRYPGQVKSQASGSGSGMNNPDHISYSIKTIFRLKTLNSLMPIREPGLILVQFLLPLLFTTLLSLELAISLFRIFF